MLFPIGTLRVVVSCAVLTFLAGRAGAQEVDFNRDIRPILSNNCYACHGPDPNVRKAKLRLDTRDSALELAIVPGEPDKSPLVQRVSSRNAEEMMPPPKSGKKLAAREIELLTQWVKEGAKYADHWAYVKPVRPAAPEIRNPAFPIRNPIDAFILYRLGQEGLRPQAEAEKYALVRRVALDLTGLPPTPEEVKEFIADSSPNAYEKLVDKLLAKPAFGEHWARMWLDLARYADSAGYADDPPRTIWLYRDYVIKSFNANKPFDQFTIEQLAGDLLPKPTREQIIATAFHRNTMTNSEGGTNDEEFRNVAVVDRVNTTFTVWMGTSIACAQCHTHKYDPIQNREYFQVLAFFNNTADADRADESPLLTIWKDADLARKNELEAQIAALENLLRGKKPTEWKPTRDLVAALKKDLAGIKPESTVPILEELKGGARRKTRVQHRGNFMDLGEEVTEGTPEAFNPFPADLPKNRLGFAKWLVSRDNPLTARVVANRFWEQIFGVGLVRTSEEFGTQGELPSHPELLDWLACELQSDWNVKRFLKLLVTTSAYRQSAKVNEELYERDPDNRLLARGPRVRLSAEMVRDQALFAAGLLSPKMLGPSVKPPQPNLGVNAAFGGAIDWQPSPGEDRYRRGIYTNWRRSNPYPSMSTFDAPNRDICVVRRARTNTPLQALVTMNDPVYVEAAQALAKRALKEKGSLEDRVKDLFQSCLIRPATDEEVKRLLKLYADAKERFGKDIAKARQFAGQLSPKEDPASHAAMTVVANVVLNLDEMLMKR
ncbi:MAG TPA: PSD1 and planctomycete cytochrome C domain-containing protein [Gemmata sp.]|nr:PSD1 and planctomycete cytochrome C domain-containing protein [Gemmata sp.]